MSTIPKIIYQIFLDSDEKDVNYKKVFQEKINLMFQKNPHYEHVFITEEYQLINWLNDNYDPIVLDVYRKIKERESKINYAKYLMLYKTGGIYLDPFIYTICDLDIIVDIYALVSASSDKKEYSDDILIFPKEHPILCRVVELMFKYISQNTYLMDAEETTGIKLLSKAIKISHFLEYNNNVNLNKMKDDDIYTFRNKNLPYKIYTPLFNGFFQRI